MAVLYYSIERRDRMKITERELESYAALIITAGVNLKKGQRLIIGNAPVVMPQIVEALARQAYRAGSPLVDAMWTSDELLRIRLQHAPDDSFTEYAHWRGQGRLEAAKRGDAFVTILSSDPELLRGEDPDHVAALIATASKSEPEFAALRMAFQMPWTVVSVPTVGWAQRVYPEESPDQAVGRLWEDLFAFCRISDGDPVAAWRAHVEEIEARKRLMTEKSYRELRFEGPGTDLTVGLPDHQRWNGGQAATPSGVVFSPNIPTEEVFTMPHRERVDGTVSASRPLHFSGMIVDDLKLRLERGRILEATASSGQQAIERLLSTDEGSKRLGEVALVSHDSPIAQSERIYFNGLIDENAASHLAVGQAYRDCVDGGKELTDEQFSTAGGNISSIHMDFMIGSDRLDVHGVTRDGKVESVLRQGLWQL